MISQPKGLVETLKHFEYDKGVVYVHTDKELMPENRSGWGNVSYLYDKALKYPLFFLFFILTLLVLSFLYIFIILSIYIF